MNATEIRNFSDEMLVVAVAEKVMGWIANIRRLGDGSLEVLCKGSPPPGFPHQEWKPLDGWDHAMQVMDAMEQRGLLLSLTKAPNAPWWVATFFGEKTATVSHEKPRRAMLEAALLALQ